MMLKPDVTHATRPDAGERPAPTHEMTLAQLHQSQKMAAVGQLTSGLAHDFNNLLQPITHALELIRRQAARGEYDRLDQHAAWALLAANRAASLAHRLLTFSRQQTEEVAVTDVDRVVTGLGELVRRTVPANVGVHLSCNALWPALINANQFENALLNLCLNARDAMRSGGDLTIATSSRELDAERARAFHVATGSYLSISVTDTGTGIAPEIVDHIFEPFFTTKPVGSGTGLGLATVYGFVKQAGGHVEVASRLGHGTTFTLYLPRCVERQGVAPPGAVAARDSVER